MRSSSENRRSKHQNEQIILAGNSQKNSKREINISKCFNSLVIGEISTNKKEIAFAHSLENINYVSSVGDAVEIRQNVL